MKKIMTLAFMIALSAFVVAQDGPKIKFEKEIYDFGEIEKGEKVSTVFKFTNTGNAVLEIKNVATSCGCTTAEMEKDAFAPGEAGEIPVTFNSQRFGGPITKRVTITTNDANSPKTIVTIKGNVVVDIVAKPANVYIKAPSGAVSEQEILVTSNKQEKLDVTNVKIEPEFFSAEATQVDAKTVSIKIKADGTKFPKGKNRLNGYLTYETNSPSQKNMRASITLSVERPIQFSPKSVYFYASKAGKERRMNINMLSTKGETFKVSDIKSDLDYVSVEVTKDDGKTKSLSVILNENAPQGKFTGSITLKTDIDGEEEVTIPIRGSVIQ